jgi:AraC-like DNA-binding protein
VATVDKRTESNLPQEIVILPEMAAVQLKHPLLAPLLVTGAGFLTHATGPFRRGPRGVQEALFVLCLKGNGWCEISGAIQGLRKGEMLVILPGTPFAVGAHASAPWTIHWAHAMGNQLDQYFRELTLVPARPILTVGEDPQVTRLFHETLNTLQRGRGFPHLLQASLAFGHLLALLVAKRCAQSPASSSAVGKVAETIIYMSENLHEPLRMPELARLANLSPDYFSEIFKQQTGCSPRDYLHLLRIHRACQLLSESGLSIKEIASQLGYQDPFHFSRQFKAFQGLSPRAYRASSPG